MDQLHRHDQSGICSIRHWHQLISLTEHSQMEDWNNFRPILYHSSITCYSQKEARHPNGRLMFLLYRHELDINHRPSTPLLVGSRYRYRSWHFEESNSSDAVAWRKTTESVVIDLPFNGQCQLQMCQQLASNYTTIILYCTIRTRDMIHNTPQVIVSSKVSKWCYKVAEPNSVDDR